MGSSAALNVLLVAEESAGIHVLRALLSSTHRIAGVLTAPTATGGGATVASVAEGADIHVQPSELVKDGAFADWVRSQDVDVLLNVHSLFLIHSDVVTAPRIGSFNLHPGPLPEYAGLNTPSWAIYHGEEHHGVTVHWMEGAIDTGAIAYESRFPIGANETGLSLTVRAVREGLPLLERLLQDAAQGRDAIPVVEQDLSRRRYFGREVPHDGRLSWERSARELTAFVRACDYFPFTSPWGHPLAQVEALSFSVLSAAPTGDASDAPPGTIGEVEGSAVRVAAVDEWILIRRVEVDGRAQDAAGVLAPNAAGT